MNISCQGLPKLSMRKLDALCATQPTSAVTEGLGISTHLQDQPLITGKGLIGCEICFVESICLSNMKILHSHGDITIIGLYKGLQNFGLCTVLMVF